DALAEGNRDHGEPVAEPDRPEADVGAKRGAAHEDRVVAGRPRMWRHRASPAQQVDLDQVRRAPEPLAALREIRFPVLAPLLVRGAQELDDGQKLATLTVADFEERHALDVLGGRLER